MALGRFTVFLGFVLVGMSGLAVCRTPIKYNSTIILCGTLGKGSFWSNYRNEHGHWVGYIKMHLNNPINIAPDIGHKIVFVPELHHVVVVGVRSPVGGISGQIRANLMKNVCLSGYLYPLLAGRWTQYVSEKVFFNVNQISAEPYKPHSG